MTNLTDHYKFNFFQRKKIVLAWIEQNPSGIVNIRFFAALVENSNDHLKLISTDKLT